MNNSLPKTITIGSQTYSRSDLNSYLQNNHLQQLIEKLVDETQLTKEEIQSKLEILTESTPQYDEVASIEFQNNVYIFKYTNTDGAQYIVSPKDPYWNRVQELLEGDALHETFKKEYGAYLEIKKEKKRKNILLLVIVGIAFIFLWAFFLGLFD